MADEQIPYGYYRAVDGNLYPSPVASGGTVGRARPLPPDWGSDGAAGQGGSFEAMGPQQTAPVSPDPYGLQLQPSPPQPRVADNPGEEEGEGSSYQEAAYQTQAPRTAIPGTEGFAPENPPGWQGGRRVGNFNVYDPTPQTQENLDRQRISQLLGGLPVTQADVLHIQRLQNQAQHVARAYAEGHIAPGTALPFLQHINDQLNPLMLRQKMQQDQARQLDLAQKLEDAGHLGRAEAVRNQVAAQSVTTGYAIGSQGQLIPLVPDGRGGFTQLKEESGVPSNVQAGLATHETAQEQGRENAANIADEHRNLSLHQLKLEEARQKQRHAEQNHELGRWLQIADDVRAEMREESESWAKQNEPGAKTPARGFAPEHYGASTELRNQIFARRVRERGALFGLHAAPPPGAVGQQGQPSPAASPQQQRVAQANLHAGLADYQQRVEVLPAEKRGPAAAILAAARAMLSLHGDPARMPPDQLRAYRELSRQLDAIVPATGDVRRERARREQEMRQEEATSPPYLSTF